MDSSRPPPNTNNSAVVELVEHPIHEAHVLAQLLWSDATGDANEAASFVNSMLKGLRAHRAISGIVLWTAVAVILIMSLVKSGKIDDANAVVMTTGAVWIVVALLWVIRWITRLYLMYGAVTVPDNATKQQQQRKAQHNRHLLWEDVTMYGAFWGAMLSFGLFVFAYNGDTPSWIEWWVVWLPLEIVLAVSGGVMMFFPPSPIARAPAQTKQT